MKIAVAAGHLGMNGVVPAYYEDSAMLIIVETEGSRIIAQYPREDSQGLAFSKRINEHRCEALVCGTMAKPGFEAVAAMGVTRYYGAGLSILSAAHRAVDNTLPFLTDYEGGTGCGAHSPGNCSGHDHDGPGKC